MSAVGDPALEASRTVPLVGIEAIRAAAERLRGVIVRTPLVPFGPPGARQFLKAESLQPIGAFKIRGAYAAIASLDAAERARGVITYSSGNHAQGVARAAALLGIRAVVVMPSDAPRIKRERVEADGAEVVVVGTASDERQRVAETIAADRGLTVIPPFDDDRIIAGQGTIGLELVDDLPDLAAVLVPIGGGGLASGVATAIKSLRPGRPRRRRRARAGRRRPGVAAARARSSAGRPRSYRGRSPTGPARRRSGNGRSRTCGRISTTSSRSPKRRSRPASGLPPRRAGWSPSRPAP